MPPSPSVSSAAVLWQKLLDVAARAGATELVVHSPTNASITTREQVLRDGEKLAGYLQSLGVGAGDVIAVQLPSWREWAFCAVAAVRLNAVILPVWTAYGAKELGYILGDSGAKVLVSPQEWKGIDFGQRLRDTGVAVKHVTTSDIARALSAPAVAIAAPAAGDDIDATALLIYTSGTTSNPKGVRHTFSSLVAEIESFQRSSGARLCPWPLGHIAGALEIYRFLLGWPTLVLMEQWDAREAAALIARYRIVATSGTPHHLATLLDAAAETDADISSVSDYLVGAAPVPPVLIERCEAIGIHTYRCYGATEHPTVSSGSPTDPLEKRLTTEGRLLPGVEVRILNENDQPLPIGAEGEIVTRGPDRSAGYLHAELNADAFTADGWYRTGDIGSLDAEGYLKVVDRKKDIIIRGGSNISSREIEECLMRHPDIQEVAAIAAPHPTLGEMVCAVVVPKPGKHIALTDISEFFAAQNMAKFKTPERLQIVEVLPRNTTGKVLKKDLRTLIDAQK